MESNSASRSGGTLLIDALRNNEVDTIFGVPGESYLEALDALCDHPNSMRFITCRQEGGAAFMADAYANATGKLGVCFVTRGPGATNASIGVHTAFQGSTPLLLLIGQVPRDQMEREAFQELDYRRVLGPMTKWVAQVNHAARIPEFINRAVRTATSGRPGPVALALPEDVLRELSDAADLPPAVSSAIQPDLGLMERLHAMLGDARRPLVVLGGTGWTTAGREAIHTFAQTFDLPVCTGFRRQGLFDNAHPCYVGNLGYGSQPPLLEYVRQADLILAVGSRLGDGTSMRFTLVQAPKPSQTLVHVMPGTEELGRIYQPDLAIQADVNAFAQAAVSLAPLRPAPWAAARQALHDDYIQGLSPSAQAGPIDMVAVMAHVRARLPAEAVVTNGAGNFADWPNKFYQYRGERTILAPVSGAMGYGVPAAVAAKLADPRRVVVAFCGDGDFLMNGQELATAVQYGLDPIILVINNGKYGTIRMHQERQHPGRVSGTDLTNPDFAVYA
ncbi:MAG: thiamine pyrophosphate-binding protein, partial [Alphaproteobacteria bacterium]